MPAIRFRLNRLQNGFHGGLCFRRRKRFANPALDIGRERLGEQPWQVRMISNAVELVKVTPHSNAHELSVGRGVELLLVDLLNRSLGRGPVTNKERSSKAPP